MIRGLSASANRQIAAFERANGFRAGEVAHSFRRWSISVRRPPDDRFWRWTDEHPDAGCSRDPHVRTTLERATWALRRKARRELREAMRPLDDHYLSRTVHNPFVRRDIPWWWSRIEL
ncbi:hypothetical protein Air01nite_04490 [Asanoa iriomotensis]|uniref:Transposase n=1 Tax=Asanoa iriomotensis TaxID=234613 RepID=A0ABQ4BV03_9ACTN|nr:hypothetical protein Air01nite_04490 [Asanoa iriomotensis]